MSSEPIIQVRKLQVKTPDGVTILHNVSCDINLGEVVCIIGPSGGGKSTLIRCLNALVKPSGGHIKVGGKDIFAPGADLVALRRRVGMVLQQCTVFEHLNVLGNVTIGPLRLLGKSRREAREEGMRLLREVGLASKANERPSALSGGEKQRVQIARCLSMHPEIILFDEPTAALDPRMRSEVEAVIRNLAKQGMTLVIVTHDHEFARANATHVLFMCNGTIEEAGTVDQIFLHPRRTLTQIFVNNLRSMTYEVANRDYDLYKLNAEIEWFCERHALGKRYLTVQLILEELLTHILPFSGHIGIRAHCPEGSSSISLEVEQHDWHESLLEREGIDDISLMLIQGMAPDIRESQQGDSRIIQFTVQ